MTSNNLSLQGERNFMEQQTEITARLDTEQLAEAWAEKKGRKPKVYLDIRMGAHTDLGRVRENNEDKFEFLEPEELELLAVKGSLYAVADGMGGHESGQIARELALKTILRTYYADPEEDVAKSLTTAFRAANSYIYDTAQIIPSRHGMGTTCTCAVFREGRFFVGQVGDSRAYLIRDGEIRQVTEDHSWVAEQVKRGALTEDEAELSPFRNVITRSLGAQSDLEVDVFEEESREEDFLLLCSDGLTGYVSNDELLQLTTEWSPSMAAMRMVDRANENGGGDNITVMVVNIAGIEKSPSKLRRLLGKR
jgi:PPM family protein phosphatase